MERPWLDAECSAGRAAADMTAPPGVGGAEVVDLARRLSLRLSRPGQSAVGFASPSGAESSVLPHLGPRGSVDAGVPPDPAEEPRLSSATRRSECRSGAYRCPAVFSFPTTHASLYSATRLARLGRVAGAKRLSPRLQGRRNRLAAQSKRGTMCIPQHSRNCKFQFLFGGCMTREVKFQ